jgi:hypothetical protein
LYAWTARRAGCAASGRTHIRSVHHGNHVLLLWLLLLLLLILDATI